MLYLGSSILVIAAFYLHSTMAAPTTEMATCAGGQLTAQSTNTVGVTVEVGFSLGLNYKAIAGEVSGSVSYSTEKGTTQGVADSCPQGDRYSALSITPTMVEVSGMATQNYACGYPGDTVPYTIRMPKLGSHGNPITNAEACTCHNLKHWADPGHVALLCPGDCALPGSSS